MSDLDNARLLSQMLDITQRRIDRQRKNARDAMHVHDEAIKACNSSRESMEDAQRQAPERRKRLLSELMVSPSDSCPAPPEYRARAPLETYSKGVELVRRKLAEAARNHEEADRLRREKSDAVLQANLQLRGAVIRREKWLALKDELSDELSRPSFEG